MAGKLPYFAFYPADWLKDPAVRACSFEARGLWIDVLCLMWQMPERGVLKTGQKLNTDGTPVNPELKGDGHVWGARTLGKAIGCSPSRCQFLMNELIRKGVCSKRDSDGAIYSRRMIREEMERSRWRESKRNVRKLSRECPQDVPPLLHSSTSEGDMKDMSPKDLSLTPPAFERFWQAYPRKVARTQAQRAWRKVPEAEVEAVLDGLDAWKKSAQWAEVDFVPYPATWLNRQQWKEPPVEGANGRGKQSGRAGGAGAAIAPTTGKYGERKPGIVVS